MENFVSVILKNREIDENAIVEAMLDALDAPLAERIQEYGLYESENDSIVVRLLTPYELDDEESDTFAESFSNKMFEMGYDDFEIETSLTEAVLKRGAKGPKVKKLQYDLGVQPADGDFGPATEKAVKAFQKLYQLKQDGIVGPNTQKMINKTVSISTKDDPQYHKSVPRSNFGALSAFRVSRRGGLMNNPKQVDSIKELQAELKRRNMYKGPIDGKYGPDTKDSVASFQKTKGLYVDGDAGPKTILALMQRDDKITTKELPPADQLDTKGRDVGPGDDNKKFNTLDGPEKGEAAYKIVTGSGQGKRYKVYDANGNELKNGRGSGPSNVPEKDEYDKKNKKDDKKDDKKSSVGASVDVVEPRPTGSGVIQDYGKNDWDKKYGKTHNPDGTPKSNKDDKKSDVDTDKIEPRPTGSGVIQDYARNDWDKKYGKTYNPDGTPKSKDGAKKSEKILGITMYKDSEEAAEALKGKSSKENQDYIVNILTQYRKEGPNGSDSLSNKEQIKMIKTIIAILDYDMRIPGFGEKNYKRLKKYLASLEGKKTKEAIDNKVGMFEETYDGDEFYEMYGWIGAPDEDLDLWEAEYRGRKVKLNKPMRGDVKKFKVYVKNPKGNIIKVNFGDPNMKIKKSNPARRRSFRARHNCDNPGPKTKARYWSCRKW